MDCKWLLKWQHHKKISTLEGVQLVELCMFFALVIIYSGVNQIKPLIWLVGINYLVNLQFF